MPSPMNIIAFLTPLRAPLAALGFLCLLLLSQHSLAEPDFIDSGMTSSTPDRSQSLVDPKPIAKPRISAAQAAELVRQQTGGQIMSVSTRQGSNGTIYGVKVLNSGRMKVIQVDGQSGQLLNH